MASGTTQKSGPGWEALARGHWPAARDWFEREVARSEYGAALEGLSWAAFWQNDAERLFWARERAYRRYREEGDPVSAAPMSRLAGLRRRQGSPAAGAVLRLSTLEP